jgi:Zn finger protein HypA/HybF involved in hydrogenase expression
MTALDDYIVECHECGQHVLSNDDDIGLCPDCASAQMGHGLGYQERQAESVHADASRQRVQENHARIER